jgi:large subunit ribosomal protein L18
VYCQLIDDLSGKTLASASSRDRPLREKIAYGGNQDAARAVGSAIAQAAQEAGIKRVRLDRGAYQYHGRLAALAAAAREAGLEL